VKPGLPCLIVRVVVYDIPVHDDEDLYDDEDPPRWRGRGNRTSTVSVNAFGAGAEAWLERATLMLRAPSVLAALGTAGFAVRPVGGLNNLSGLLDEHTQVRFERDFAVDYIREGVVPDDVEEVVPLEEVVYDADWQGQPDTREETVTEVLS
jgi:hypothetical protein